MANGLDLRDWSVTWDGENGTVAFGLYRGRFTANRSGVIRIIWILDSAPEPGPDNGALNRAAQQAASQAVNL